MGTPSGSAVGSIPTVSVLCLITTMWPAELLMGPALHRPPMVHGGEGFWRRDVMSLATHSRSGCLRARACLCVWVCVAVCAPCQPAACPEVELLSCGALLLCSQ